MIKTLYLSIEYFFLIYPALLIINIALTWIPHNYYHPLVKFINAVTDPYLDLFRQLPLRFGGMDFSPILALMVLGPIQNILYQLLRMLNIG